MASLDADTRQASFLLSKERLRNTGNRASAAVLAALLLVSVVSVLGPTVNQAALAGTFPGTNGQIAFVSSRDLGEEIYVMNPDGTGQINVSNAVEPDRDPSWSPDGTKIAFTRFEEDSEIYVIDADGTDQDNITNNADLDSDPSWSPDGAKIAFSGFVDRGHKIHVMNADGSGRIMLTDNDASDENASWSPDGTQIAFSRDVQIHVMNADGTGQTNLSEIAGVPGFSPSWSPDGSKIAFWGGFENIEIYAINPDGTGLTNLTNHPGFDIEPSWSPDGTKIAFSTTRDGNFEIYVMNANGSGQTNLSNNPGDDKSPDWGVHPSSPPTPPPAPSPAANPAPVADFNGDGYSDLAIGVPNENVNSNPEAGLVNVIYGSASGLSATVVADQRFFQDYSAGTPNSNIRDFSEANDHFGAAVAAGDFNDDGYSDLATGVPDEDIGSAADAGAVNVIYGSLSGLLSSDTVAANQLWSQDSANVEDATESGDHFGSALAVHDFNGDGYDDLAVGVPNESINGKADAGAVNIIFGSPTGLSATSTPDQRFFQDYLWLFSGAFSKCGIARSDLAPGYSRRRRNCRKR